MTPRARPRLGTPLISAGTSIAMRRIMVNAIAAGLDTRDVDNHESAMAIADCLSPASPALRALRLEREAKGARSSPLTRAALSLVGARLP